MIKLLSVVEQNLRISESDVDARPEGVVLLMENDGSFDGE